MTICGLFTNIAFSPYGRRTSFRVKHPGGSQRQRFRHRTAAGCYVCLASNYNSVFLCETKVFIPEAVNVNVIVNVTALTATE